MDDLEQRLARSLHDAAADAPPDSELLDKVHRRSGRHRRRRLAVQGAGLAVVLTVAVPVVTGLGNRPRPDTAPPATIEVTESVQLVPGFRSPVFPYALPPSDGMRSPVVTLRSGRLTALYEATDLRRHADTTVTLSTARPSFTAAAEETTVQVRGHTGRLRTTDVQPARQYALYWQEKPGQWLQLATDDTYSKNHVVALAESLTAGAIPVLPPFALEHSPAGLTPDTIDASTMSFRSPEGGLFTVVLRKKYQLTAPNTRVATYAARLTRDTDGARLEIAVTDWDAVLQVTVSPALSLSDQTLLRFAAGVRILDRSDPK